MNREQLVQLDDRRALRTTQPFELRAATDDGGPILVHGYPCITEHWYEMYGGPPYGWEEKVARGAFGKTLSESPKVDFLVNHDGLPLSSSTAPLYKIELSEDDTGLDSLSAMDPTESDVALLVSKMTNLLLREMSFAFRITRQRWEELDGSEGDSATAPRRVILEVSLHKGDISIVNNGANDATWATLRELDQALAELRNGGQLSDEHRALVRTYLATEPIEIPPEPPPTERAVMSAAQRRAYVASGRPLPEVA